MNLKAIIASLVIGSSSVAMASPAVVYDHRAADPCAPAAPVAYQPVSYQPAQPIYRQPVAAPLPPQYQPVTLGSGLTFNGGRTFLTVGAQAGRFEKLDIHTTGRTFVQQVYIQFANGQEQVIRNLNRTLTTSDCLTLDLDGNHRAINRVVVYGKNLSNGWRRAPSSFSVTAA